MQSTLHTAVIGMHCSLRLRLVYARRLRVHVVQTAGQTPGRLGGALPFTSLSPDSRSPFPSLQFLFTSPASHLAGPSSHNPTTGPPPAPRSGNMPTVTRLQPCTRHLGRGWHDNEGQRHDNRTRRNPHGTSSGSPNCMRSVELCNPPTRLYFRRGSQTSRARRASHSLT